MAFDIMQTVTDKIIEQLEHGEIPWTKPWIGGGCVSYRSGRPYSLLNQLLLSKDGEYLTYKEAEQAGGYVKKGAKGKFVVFWKMNVYESKDIDGKPILDGDGKPFMKQYPFLRYYTVFHIDDCEGVKPKWTKTFSTSPIEDAEKVMADYVSRSEVKLENANSARAYYSPSEHKIHLPLIEQFESVAEYYSTAFHEATHSTGHPSLLDRFPADGMAVAFDSESYSKEELVAEMGACAILSHLGIQTESAFRNSAAYVQSWLKALKNDKYMVVSAASKAEKAMKMILNLKEEEQYA